MTTSAFSIQNSYNFTAFNISNSPPSRNSPDLAEPHILRSLSNVKISSIHASSHGCHSIMLDISGTAWMFGRNERASLGAIGREHISENAPIKLLASTLHGASPKTRFVHAACGRNHSILVGSEGQVWSTGANNLGQCGLPSCPEVPTWQQVKGTFGGGRVIKAAAGITFSIVLTEQGRREWATYISFQALTIIPVFSFGSGEHGQLGNGRTGEHIITGNKTAYDVHNDPSESFIVPRSKGLPSMHISVRSRRQSARRKACYTNSLRPTTLNCPRFRGRCLRMGIQRLLPIGTRTSEGHSFPHTCSPRTPLYPRTT
jgi:hypothetical protein